MEKKILHVFSPFFKSHFSFSSFNFQKIPKIIPKPPSFSFESIINRMFLSPKMDILANELFNYLTGSPEFKENFPIILDNTEIYSSLIVMHVYLLYRRIAHEESHFAKKEAEKLLFCFKSKYFLKFAESMHQHIPVKDFTAYFSENFNMRYQIFEKEFNGMYNQSKTIHLSKEEELEELKKIIRKLVFFNKFPLKHAYISKTVKYYDAHDNYLFSLSFTDLIDYQIYWGFLNRELLE